LPIHLVADVRNVIRNTPSEDSSSSQPGSLSFPCGVLCLLLLLFYCCSNPYGNIANLDSEGTTIVCFGDSITAGYGISVEQAFPFLIADRLDVEVINAGRDGDTTFDALARLESDVLAYRPRLVIVEFGGNDFRKRMEKAETLKNMEAIVRRILDNGAIVVIMEIRIGPFGGKYLDGYQSIAEEHHALLIPNFMAGILGNNNLTVDGIHPTSEGHGIIAERIIENLIPLLKEADQSLSATQ
jgi:acyl-CoA thioesterase-1